MWKGDILSALISSWTLHGSRVACMVGRVPYCLHGGVVPPPAQGTVLVQLQVYYAFCTRLHSYSHSKKGSKPGLSGENVCFALLARSPASCCLEPSVVPVLARNEASSTQEL